ncbi:MAG: hypothetical protein KAS39_05825 [Actinomycetia bacterium]|nr:hypothetical protein [Actinomycetes bacterium]
MIGSWEWVENLFDRNEAGKESKWVGTIYHQPGSGKYSSTISDLKNLTFSDLNKIRAWMIAEKNGKNEKINTIKTKLKILEDRLNTIAKIINK